MTATPSDQDVCRQPEVDGKSPVETPAYVAFVSRILTAASRRVGRGDIGSLEHLAGLRRDLDDAIAQAVTELHTGPYAYSWATIGAALGITRQAAQQRYGADAGRPTIEAGDTPG